MNVDWKRFESRIVNGAFPLQQLIGTTDHSAVFVTQATKHAPSALALKLVPFDAATGPRLLAQWRAATELFDPHLLRLFEAGECDLDGQRFLYARMELADQTLADALAGSAISEQEAREVLVATLGALDTLHQGGFVQGALKPSNLLILGDRLKLASDTVRAIDASDARATPAADIHALGVVLCEALTLRKPGGLDGAGPIALPTGLPDAFREVIGRCLDRDPRRRPTVRELQAWLDGAPLVAAAKEVAPTAPTRPPAPAPVPASASSPASRLVIRVELPSHMAPPARAVAEERTGPRVWTYIVGAALIVAMGIVGYVLRPGDRDTGPVVAEAPVSVPVPVPVPMPVPAPEPQPEPAAPVATAPTPPTVPPETPVDEVLPTASRNALGTIQGTVRVAVRLSIARDGSVNSVTTENAGPSRYFERQSVEAARRWKFVPVDADAPRSVRVRFEFRRSGVTARSEAVK